MVAKNTRNGIMDHPSSRKDDGEAALSRLSQKGGAVSYLLVDPNMRKKRSIPDPVIMIATGDVYGMSPDLLLISVPGYGSTLVDKAGVAPGRLAKAGLSIRASRLLARKLNEVFANATQTTTH